MALLVLLVPLAILALLDVAALRRGVDSRDESPDLRAPWRPVGIETR